MGWDPYDIDVSEPQLGPERFADKGQYTRLRDAGIPIAAGADWPTGPIISPWDMIQMGATGQEVDQAKPPRTIPFEVEEMVEMFTNGGAYLMFREDIIGSLEAGKRADLIVIDQNIFETTSTRPRSC